MTAEAMRQGGGGACNESPFFALMKRKKNGGRWARLCSATKANDCVSTGM